MKCFFLFNIFLLLSAVSTFIGHYVQKKYPGKIYTHTYLFFNVCVEFHGVKMLTKFWWSCPDHIKDWAGLLYVQLYIQNYTWRSKLFFTCLRSLHLQDSKLCTPTRSTKTSPRRSLLSEYHTVSRHNHKWNFIYTFKKSIISPALTFTELIFNLLEPIGYVMHQ